MGSEYTQALWVERIAAFILDILIAFAALIIILSIVPAPQFQQYAPEQIQQAMGSSFELSAIVIGWTIIMNLLFFAYFFITQFYWNRTPGMMLFRLQIDVPAEKRTSRLFIRNLQLFVLLPHIPGYFLVPIVDGFWAIFSKQKQRGLDIVTQCSVVKQLR